jgi:hypothetical protein
MQLCVPQDIPDVQPKALTIISCAFERVDNLGVYRNSAGTMVLVGKVRNRLSKPLNRPPIASDAGRQETRLSSGMLSMRPNGCVRTLRRLIQPNEGASLVPFGRLPVCRQIGSNIADRSFVFSLNT